VSEPWTSLFRRVFADCPGWLELRAFPSKARVFLPPDDDAGIAHFVRQHAEQDLYFGCASRRDPQTTHPGALANCEALGVLFCDIDFAVTPEAEVRRRLARLLPFVPCATVASGGGWHCYFALREPLLLRDDAPTAKRALRRLARTLGGDLSAAEPARILRIPGTTNFKAKYGAPRPVRLEPDERRHATV
jgi:hypothetical protein